MPLAPLAKENRAKLHGSVPSVCTKIDSASLEKSIEDAYSQRNNTHLAAFQRFPHAPCSKHGKVYRAVTIECCCWANINLSNSLLLDGVPLKIKSAFNILRTPWPTVDIWKCYEALRHEGAANGSCQTVQYSSHSIFIPRVLLEFIKILD
ncbi:uncharacterized protein LOC120902131 [Anopheles arabiensis]|uniref:uncharacterized protein LOC120902131 n=1 Tax=Anopheles arabiensis TaxID=7173 RepID=UPI001AACE177|nr:uncharacterized protein LOC120902131 [Anopheles arabiensis]